MLTELSKDCPLADRALDLIARLEEVSPTMAAWRELPPECAAPMPRVSPEEERAACAILVELYSIALQLDRSGSRKYKLPVH